MLGDGPEFDNIKQPVRQVKGRVMLENVDEVFTYHAPTPEQVIALREVNDVMLSAVKTLLLKVPDCADRSVAIRKIREARMDANAAIVLNGLI